MSPRRWQKNSISSHSKVINEILTSTAEYDKQKETPNQTPISPSKRLEELHRKITDPFNDESALVKDSVDSSIDNPEIVKARYYESESMPDLFLQTGDRQDPESPPEVTQISPEERKRSERASPGPDTSYPDLGTIQGLKDAMKKKYQEQFDARASAIESGAQTSPEATPLVKLDSLITEHTIKHAAEIVAMKKQLRKEDQNERVKLLSEERAKHEKLVETLSAKHQKELKRLEDLLTTEREAHDLVIQEVVMKHEQEIQDLTNEHRMTKFEADFAKDSTKKELQTVIDEEKAKNKVMVELGEEVTEKFKDAERQIKVLKSQLTQKCTIDDETLQSAINNERELAESKLAEYSKCLETQKQECENAIKEMESIYTQKLQEKVKEIEDLNKKTSDFAKQILELTDTQKKQNEEITSLKRTNTSLRKYIKEVKGKMPEQIEQARLEERKVALQLESKVERLAREKSELKSELDQSVDAQELNNLEVGILSALEKKDMIINTLRKQIEQEQAKNNKLELDLEKVKIELLK